MTSGFDSIEELQIHRAYFSAPSDDAHYLGKQGFLRLKTRTGVRFPWPPVFALERRGKAEAARRNL